MAALSHFWGSLPHLSNLISAISLGLGGLFLYRIGEHWGAPVAGIVAAALSPFFPLMVRTFGAETCFYVMLCLGAFACYASERFGAAMILAALATLTRTDGVLVAGLLGAHLLVVQRRIRWRLVALYSLVIAPWYLFSWVRYGSPFPVTLAAKQHQGQMAISDSFAQGFVNLLRGYGGHPAYWVHGALALLGLSYASVRARQWLPFLTWGVVYFVAYTLLGVSRYFWYYAPLVPVILVATGLGVAAIKLSLPARLLRGWRGPALLMSLLVVLLWPQVRAIRHARQYPDQRVDVYREVGTWVSQNTPEDASVGTLEVGIIGYYAQRRLVGFAGLIQPEVALQMDRDTTYEDTARWAVREYRPDYLVLGTGWFPSLMEKDVTEHCEPVRAFTSDRYQGELVVYRCQWVR